MTDVRFLKVVVFVNSLIPLVLLLWDLYRKRVGPNPLQVVTTTTGMLTLIFLSLTVAITPLRKIFGINSLVKLRRMLGLFAFFYGSLHLLTYVWFDRGFDFVSVIPDVEASVHPRRHDRVFADGAAGDYVNEQDGEASRRKALGETASSGLSIDHRRSGPLLDAC